MKQVFSIGNVARDHFEQQLATLAATRADGRGWLSCFVDRVQDTREQLAALLECALQTVPAAEREAFNEAATKAADALRGQHSKDWRSLALFVHAGDTAERATVVPLAAATEPGVSWNPVPDVTPLLAVRGLHRPLAVIMARRGGVQLLEVRGTLVSQRAWTSRPQSGPGNGRSPIADLWVRMLRRGLSAIGNAVPIVVAGDADQLETAVGWLPQRLRSRLLGTVPLAGRLDQRRAIAQVLDHVESLQRDEGRVVAARLVRTVQAGGRAVAGQAATREVLLGGGAETLIVAADGMAGTDGRCDRPQASLELAHLALQRGVAVTVVDSDELRYIGGVGCLLAQHAEQWVMPRPPARATLDLVA